jgi:hypothetical protein
MGAGPGSTFPDPLAADATPLVTANQSYTDTTGDRSP